MEMKEGDSINAHMKKMKELTNKLAVIGAAIAEEDQVVSLPSKYLTPVTALEAKNELTFGYVQQSLLHEEEKLTGEYRFHENSAGGRSTAMYRIEQGQ